MLAYAGGPGSFRARADSYFTIVFWNDSIRYSQPALRVGVGSGSTPSLPVPRNDPIGGIPGADSNPECRLGVTNGVVPKDDSKVRVGVGLCTEGSRSAITAKNRFTTGNNHNLHQALNPVPLMSLKLSSNFKQTTLSNEKQ
ncbi:unnamed protein product [Orchesella dallaii]|uniref:Uncharacterized protein n=1 Tax=Orchesella dallaii TaxID=48710 RepID=A0ABP1QHS5_9HEXA